MTSPSVDGRYTEPQQRSNNVSPCHRIRRSLLKTCQTNRPFKALVFHFRFCACHREDLPRLHSHPPTCFHRRSSSRLPPTCGGGRVRYKIERISVKENYKEGATTVRKQANLLWAPLSLRVRSRRKCCSAVVEELSQNLSFSFSTVTPESPRPGAETCATTPTAVVST